MIPLARKLRQLRGWQRLPLAECSKKAEWAQLPEKALKSQTLFESGEMDRDRYERHIISLAHAYGVVPKALERWIEDEWEWRVCAGKSDGKGQGLPWLARYLYRGLPEAAHHLFEDGFVILDTETTGKDPHRFTAMCEITILDTDGTVLLNSLINPGFHMPVEAKLVHGITDEMVKDAPTFKEIGTQIARIMSNHTVVIYNAGFDAYLLDRLFIENGVDMPDFDPWCLMKAYADHMQFPGKYGNYAWQSLSDACAQQELELGEDAHRTLADTLAAWTLLQKMALQGKKEQA